MDRDKIAQRSFEVICIAILITIGCSMVSLKHDTPLIEYKEIRKDIPIVVSDTFSTALLKKEIKKNNIKFPDTVYAQARLETGNFTSKYFKERNNLFGFRARNGYMYFRDWKESVVFYARWQKKYYRSGEDYFEFLTRIGYAEADSVYKKRILGCIKSKHGF